VARVLPDVAGFERELDYLVPPELAGEVRPGSIVRAPLQGRRVRGWALAFPVRPPAGLALKALKAVSSWGPEPELVELAAWAAWRWAGRRRSFLVAASPVRNAKELPAPKAASPPAKDGRARPAPKAAWLPAGPSLAPTPASATPASASGAALLAQAWRPGTHIIRLPPAAGATELVLAAAERGPVLVLAPTAARAQAGSAALRSRGVAVALLPDEWAQARAGARVVIGSRGAAWGPCPSLASVIVLDAHDEAFVQGQAPTWSAPEVAAERARRAGVPCFWVSPCPTLEMLARADGAWALSRAEERGGWAALWVVDRRREDPREGLFSRRLVSVLRDPSRRVVCVLNRKGRATLLDCAACGELATCERCAAAVGAPATSPAGSGRGPLDIAVLECRRCGQRRPVVCAKCGSTALRALRLGVSGVREQAEALAGRPVGEVTASTQQLPGAPVLVGTEALLYRESDVHRSGGAKVVAFLDFDQELLAPRYRAGEEALALLARASRLVGGREGAVLVQTRSPEHPVLRAALLADPGRLAAAEEPVRKELRLPPFSALALLSGPGAEELALSLERSARGGPGDRRAGVPWPGAELELSEMGDGRWLLRAPSHEELAGALAAAGRPKNKVRVEVAPARL